MESIRGALSWLKASFLSADSLMCAYAFPCGETTNFKAFVEVDVLEVRFEPARCQHDPRRLVAPNWTQTEHREHSMGETKAG